MRLLYAYRGAPFCLQDLHFRWFPQHTLRSDLNSFNLAFDDFLRCSGFNGLYSSDFFYFRSIAILDVLVSTLCRFDRNVRMDAISTWHASGAPGVLALAALATRPRWRSGVRSHRRVARHLSAPRALPDLPQQLAVAAAAAASHPELDDITITTVAAVDWQA